MPGVEIDSHGIAAVEKAAAYLYELLDHAESIKPSRSLEPALSKNDFDDIYGHVERLFAGFDEAGERKLRQFAIVETAARDVFGGYIASTTINSPDFVRVWNLFDILAILADNMECDPPLLFWLIEELLDSQTIAGCRKVFDYLESRRERITAKYFNSTKLVILRMCNDLLRRLSRADDTSFCGRVFIFLFQVFPLGDKSSVNLRGEYHVENVTTYDETPAAPAEDKVGGDAMDVDATATDTAKKSGADKRPNIDFAALYPVFWSLQASFSQPKRLFDPAHFGQFRSAMDASLSALRQIKHQDDVRRMRQLDESKAGIKRKRDKEDELADTYNPKYLTSRDLFELETSDLTFRRHFLLQALIIMEFLLSLSPRAKEKLASVNIQNKSVTYSDVTLSDEDTAWATKMKNDITDHIKSSNADGPYFLRMVDTILARDKNWVRWKIESCPSIERPPVSPEGFLAAEDAAQRAFGRHTRRRSAAMGSFSLDFLDEEDPAEALEELKRPSRSKTLALDVFEREIADEDFEIDMPDSDASKQQAEERKASKTWRALRIVRQTNLATFDKIDDDSNVQLIFKIDSSGAGEDDDDDIVDADAEDGAAASGDAASKDKMPANTRPVVLVGPVSETALALAKLLTERKPSVFGIVGQHTTRPAPPSTEVAKVKSYYQYVDDKAFEALLDGDQFVAFSETAGQKYGTSRKQIDAVKATHKIPLVVMNYESVDSAKGNEFAGRYIFIESLSKEALAPLLKSSGVYDNDDDAALAEALSGAEDILRKAKDGEQGLFDKTVAVTDADLPGAVELLEQYIYEDAQGDGDGDVEEEEMAAAPEEADIKEEEGKGGEAEEDKDAADGTVAGDAAIPAAAAKDEDAEMADAGAESAAAAEATEP